MHQLLPSPAALPFVADCHPPGESNIENYTIHRQENTRYQKSIPNGDSFRVSDDSIALESLRVGNHRLLVTVTNNSPLLFLESAPEDVNHHQDAECGTGVGV